MLEARGYAERDRREDEGEGDRLLERQKLSQPLIDDSLVGFKIEMLFFYTEPDGDKLYNWYNRVVASVVNERTKCVEVTWDLECLGDNDKKVTKEKVLPTFWNPKSKKEKAWRQYLMV